MINCMYGFIMTIRQYCGNISHYLLYRENSIFMQANILLFAMYTRIYMNKYICKNGFSFHSEAFLLSINSV